MTRIFAYVVRATALAVVFAGCFAASALRARAHTSGFSDDVAFARGNETRLNLTGTIAIFEDPTHRLALRHIADSLPPSAFRRSSETAINLGYSNSAQWMRFAIAADSSGGGQRLLEFDNPNVWRLSFFALRRGDTLANLRLGIAQPFVERAVEHKNFLMPLELQAGDTITCYACIVSNEPVRLSVRLWRPEAFWARDAERQLLTGLYYGMLLLVAMYNAMLFALVRDRSYFWFALLILTSSVLQATNEGLAYQYLWRAAPAWNQEGRGLLNGLMMLCVAFFTLAFLRNDSLPPRLMRGLWAAAAAAAQLALLKALGYAEELRWWEQNASIAFALIVCALTALWRFKSRAALKNVIAATIWAFWFGALAAAAMGGNAPGWYDRLMNAVVPMSVISAALWAAARGTLLRQPASRWYLLSMSAIALGGFGELALHVGFLPSTLLTESFFKAGHVLTVFLLSLPLGERINALLRRTQQLELETLEARRALAEARLEALQAKMNPHFLFNTLNSIASLIPADAAKAEEAVVRLSGLLRYALGRASGRSTKGAVTLAEELEITRAYLELERLRLAGRLRVAWEIEGDTAAVRLPALTLQPIAENAVKYAIAPRIAGGSLAIRVRVEETLCRVEIQDDGPGLGGAGGSQGTRQGLENTQERLRLMFGERCSFALRDEGGLTVSITLPVETKQ